MGRKSNEAIEIVIVNPEDIPAAKKKFTEVLYTKYIEYLAEHNLTKLEDPKDTESKRQAEKPI